MGHLTRSQSHQKYPNPKPQKENKNEICDGVAITQKFAQQQLKNRWGGNCQYSVPKISEKSLYFLRTILIHTHIEPDCGGGPNWKKLSKSGALCLRNTAIVYVCSAQYSTHGNRTVVVYIGEKNILFSRHFINKQQWVDGGCTSLPCVEINKVMFPYPFTFFKLKIVEVKKEGANERAQLKSVKRKKREPPAAAAPPPPAVLDQSSKESSTPSEGEEREEKQQSK